jgi:MFS family permease
MQTGLIQWLLVEVFYCLHVLTLTAYAIGADELQKALNLSSVQMGSLAAAFFVAFGLSQLLVGSQLGTRPNRWMIGGSAAVATLGALLLLGSDNFTTALLARLLMGAGVGNALVSTVHVVSERFPERFPLMTNLSQAIANLSGAAIGLAIPLLPSLRNITSSYQLGFSLLLIDTVLIIVFCRDGRKASSTDANAPAQSGSLIRRTARLLALQPFWSSMAFFAGLFGSYLSFAEVWNIQFQIEVFHESGDYAPLINTAVIIGLAIGSLASGAIADRVGHVRPARVGALLTLTMLILLLSHVLPLWLAVMAQVLLGLGMGTATLGLTALRCSVPAHEFPLASSLMLTGVFISAGLLSAAVGLSAGDLSVATSGFAHYQQAMLWFAAFAGIAVIASLTMHAEAGPKKA